MIYLTDLVYARKSDEKKSRKHVIDKQRLFETNKIEQRKHGNRKQQGIIIIGIFYMNIYSRSKGNSNEQQYKAGKKRQSN